VNEDYAIVVVKPFSLSVGTSDAECNKLTAYEITNIVMIDFDCRQGAIVCRHGRQASVHEVGWGCAFAMDETGDRVLTTEFDTICALQVWMKCSQVVALESVVGDIGTLDTLHWSKRVRLQKHWNPSSST
jgi:hypothetical protein